MRYISLAALLHIAAFSIQAEGTKELRPLASDFGFFQLDQGWGNFALVGAPATDRFNINVCNTGETIYMGFRLRTGGPVSYRLVDPTGAVVIPLTALPGAGQPGYINTHAEAIAGPQQVVGAGGYNAIQYSPAMTGNYYIEFQKTAGRETFDLLDITVAGNAGNVQTGRLWSQAWQIATDGYNNPFNGKMYIYTTDSVVSEVDFNGILPFSMIVRANGTGPVNTGNLNNDRRSVNGNNSYPLYKIFLNDPVAQCFPSRGIDSIDVKLTGCGNSFCFDVTSVKSGVVEILIELNGVPGYQPTTADIRISDSVFVGTTCVPWDGRDGLGNPVTGGTSIIVNTALSSVAIHMPLYDVEAHPNGFKVRFVRPFSGTPLLFWDDTGIPGGGANLGGCAAASGCHTWTGGQGAGIGEVNTINTWWFTPDFINQFQIAIPKLDAVVSKTDLLCHGDSNGTASVGASGDNPPFTFLWSTGSAGTSHSGLPAGTYTVTITDSKGCTTVRPVTVSQPPPLTAATTPAGSTGCQSNGSATVVATGGTPGYTYLWNSIPAQSGATATGLGKGTFAVTVTDQNNCTAADTVFVDGDSTATFAAFAFDGKMTCSGYSAQFTNLTADGVSFLWDFGDGSTSASADPFHTFTPGAGYVVVLRVTNAQGCADTTSLIVNPGDLQVQPGIIPNVFTPNYDGYNDCFMISPGPGLGNCGELIVYNRWGVRIFDNRFGICWDGKTDTGVDAPEGTYYWIYRLGDRLDLHGWVALVRDSK